MKTKNNHGKKKQNLFRPSFFATLLILFAFFYIIYTHAQPINGNSIVSTNNSMSGDIQIVKIHVEGANYIMESSPIKAGQPVKLVADLSKMPGCSRSIIISEFGVRKTFTSSDNSIIFTPTKAGTFNIACSMNMYKGTFNVLESDGTKSNYIEPTKTGGMTCGMGGGCGGCGMK